MTTIPVIINRRFAEDREERGLSNGEGYWLRNEFHTRMTEEELSEYLSDLYHYGGPVCGMDALPANIRRSAVGTYRWTLLHPDLRARMEAQQGRRL